LRDGESLSQEIVSMFNRTPANLRARGFAEAQRVPELIEEHGNAVIDLGGGGRWNRPRGDFGPAPADNLIPIESDEFVEHKTLNSVDVTA
jgi:hypothetical protein